MGHFANMTLSEYDTDIRRRLARRSRLLAKQYKDRNDIGGDYEKAQRALTHHPDFSERRLADEWTGAGRRDSMFLLQYQNSLRSLVAKDYSVSKYWRFVSSWLNERDRFGGRSELDQVLWVKFLVPQYDLPFIRSPVFGPMMTPDELDQLRYFMRMEPFLIDAKMGTDFKPLSQADINRVMTAFDVMKMQRKNVVALITEDMARFEEWLGSPPSSDLTGQKAVERASEPIRKLGNAAPPRNLEQAKKCPRGHFNPASVKYCCQCTAPPYRFPDTLPVCNHCGTRAFSDDQKTCHECGSSLAKATFHPSH